MQDYCQEGVIPVSSEVHRQPVWLEKRRFEEAQPEFQERFRLRRGIKVAHAHLKKLILGCSVAVQCLKTIRCAVTLKALGEQHPADGVLDKPAGKSGEERASGLKPGWCTGGNASKVGLFLSFPSCLWLRSPWGF